MELAFSKFFVSRVSRLVTHRSLFIICDDDVSFFRHQVCYTEQGTLSHVSETCFVVQQKGIPIALLFEVLNPRANGFFKALRPYLH